MLEIVHIHPLFAYLLIVIHPHVDILRISRVSKRINGYASCLY